jgi:hypothetical protein
MLQKGIWTKQYLYDSAATTTQRQWPLINDTGQVRPWPHALFQDLGNRISNNMQVRGDANRNRQELGTNVGSGQSVAGTCAK